MSLLIAVDYDQADWGCIGVNGTGQLYGDGELPGLWVPDKGIAHWGGSTVPPLFHRNCLRLIRGWDRYHTNDKGWRSIAYNYLFCNHGYTFRGRGWNQSGATSGDWEGDGIRENAEAVAICWLGGSAGKMSAKAFEAAGYLWRETHRLIGIEPQVGIGHRDVKSTTCPGDVYYAWVQEQGWQEDDMDYRSIIDLIGPQRLEQARLEGRWAGETAYYFDGRSSSEDEKNLVEHLIVSFLSPIPRGEATTPNSALDASVVKARNAGVFSVNTQPEGVAYNDEQATFWDRLGLYGLADRVAALEASSGGNGLQDGDVVQLNKQ